MPASPRAGSWSDGVQEAVRTKRPPLSSERGAGHVPANRGAVSRDDPRAFQICTLPARPAAAAPLSRRSAVGVARAALRGGTGLSFDVVGDALVVMVPTGCQGRCPPHCRSTPFLRLNRNGLGTLESSWSNGANSTFVTGSTSTRRAGRGERDRARAVRIEGGHIVSDEWDEQLTEAEQNLAASLADLTSVRYGPWSPSRPGFDGCRPSSLARRKSPSCRPMPTLVGSTRDQPDEHQRRVNGQAEPHAAAPNAGCRAS